MAEFGFLYQILLFLSLDGLEVVLMTLVDDSRSIFEAFPYLVAQLLGHGASFAIFLMQLLQLVEGRNNVLHIGQLFSSLAQVRLYFKIFLKVVSAHLVVETQLVVELLRIVLVVFPQFGSILSRHGFDILPFGLQVLHLVIALVGVVGSGREFLDAFNNLLLAFQVGQFSFSCSSAALLRSSRMSDS